MKTSNKIAIIAVIIILLGGAFILFMPTKSKAPANSDSQSTTSGNKDGDSAFTEAESSVTPAVTITYDGKTFTSSANKLTSGEAVKVVNSSDDALDFDSDPHPVHTDDPELNAGNIAPGESKTFILTTKGTWGYHNHLDSSQRGEITVE